MKNLKQIREDAGMSLEELAYKAEVKFHTLVAYEDCKRNAPLEPAARIAEVLGVPIEDLRK